MSNVTVNTKRPQRVNFDGLQPGEYFLNDNGDLLIKTDMRTDVTYNCINLSNNNSLWFVEDEWGIHIEYKRVAITVDP